MSVMGSYKCGRGGRDPLFIGPWHPPVAEMRKGRHHHHTVEGKYLDTSVINVRAMEGDTIQPRITTTT